MSMHSITEAVPQLCNESEILDSALTIFLPQLSISVHSNNSELLAQLGDYFRHLTQQEHQHQVPSQEIIAFEQECVDLNVNWTDWKREPGKSGRKDAFYDCKDGRLFLKVRTGMLFCQHKDYTIASGPCLKNINQVINFIINQYMTLLQQNNWLICHAAACTTKTYGLAFAGFSGGGKSTSMLHALELEGLHFMSNDRLFIKREGQTLEACGVPKLPRVNPGTLINSERLQSIVSEKDAARYRALDTAELWDLEEKYDVDVLSTYGQKSIHHHSPLNYFFILNWQRDSQKDFSLQQFQADEREDLLAALMKCPGPFYHDSDGRYLNGVQKPNAQPYIEALSSNVRLYEISGRVDFVKLNSAVRDILAGLPA